ncbi:MAG: Gfo/Idh/MocA family oxidoreductase [Paraprevotella sp.]|nr:Gfo/Idh/MocA family oxidoreductase [Paraprevotella sp.]
MKKLRFLFAGVMATMLAFASVSCSNVAKEANADGLNPQFTTKWSRGEDGVIRTVVPSRPIGQEHALLLKTAALDTVRVGFVGLGMRGPGAVERWTHMNDVGLNVRIVALCDYVPERAAAANKILERAGLPKAAEYSGEFGYKELCERNDIDIVYVATDWMHHVPVALYAMEQGKHAAIEVPSAMSVQDCWDLINMSEKTRLHCIQLENCCYDEFEMNTLNMAQKGIFGEIVHVEGAYIHNLDDFWGYYWKKDENDKLGWRMEYNRMHRGDVYATHGLGPACQLLDIHRGDRMKTLVAMDTKSFHGAEYVKNKTGEECTDFQNGDQTTTLIRTEKGKVIEIQHNVMNPQPYSRMYQLTGTTGFANKYPVQGYALEGKASNVEGIPNHENLNAHGFLSPEAHAALVAQYRHPLYQEIGEKAKTVGGHGGMDFIMDYRLVYCLQNGLPLDMDVYDLAEWCCVAELGYISMSNNCAPVEVPDFTRGHWNEVQGLKLHKAE